VSEEEVRKISVAAGRDGCWNPWFAMKCHGGRMCMLIESPPAFRERNIFVSANALSRA
jgi:hypothetical protein